MKAIPGYLSLEAAMQRSTTRSRSLLMTRWSSFILRSKSDWIPSFNRISRDEHGSARVHVSDRVAHVYPAVSVCR